MGALGSILGGAAGGASISIVIKAIDQFSNPLKKAQKGIEQTGKTTNKLTSFFKANQVAIMAAAGAIVGFGVDAVKSALKSEQAFQSFNLVVGDTADLLLDEMQRASKGMISDFELVSNANRALALGIQKNDIPGLLEVATARAKIFGRTATEAFNDLAIGIGRGSRLILDNLGIILDLNKVNSDYAKVLGKNSDELTEMEKKQALVNAILEESAGLVKAQNFLLETHAEMLARVKSDWDNFKDSVGAALIQVYDYISGQELLNETWKAQISMVTGLEGTYDDTTDAIMDLDRAQKRLTDDLSTSNQEAQKLIDSLLDLSDITFKGERSKTLEIAQQKEVIRQLELQKLRRGELEKITILEEELNELEKIRINLDLAGEETKDTDELIKTKKNELKLSKLSGDELENRLETEKDKLQELRLENERYANEREIQQAQNAIQLEDIGELESVNFQQFIQNEQQKFAKLEEERNKQEDIRNQIKSIQDAESELLSVFDDVMKKKLLGYSDEDEAVEDLISRIQRLAEEYKDAAREQKMLYGKVSEEMTPVEAEKAMKERGITPTPEFESAKTGAGIGEFFANPADFIFDWFDKIAESIFPSYQTGGVVQATGPAVVHKGEYITPANQMGGVTIIIEGNIYGTDPDEMAEAMATQINKVIRL